MKKEEIELRHNRSKKLFPELQLEDDEYVEVAVTRAPQSYFVIWIAVLLGILILAISFVAFSNSFRGNGDFLALIVLVMSAFLIIYGLLVTNVFRHNKMLITNKRITQYLMVSPIASSVNIIDLSAIEDVSFRQDTVFQKLFKFGTLRLSTVGDETTYTFTMTTIAPKEIAEIVKLVNDDRDGKKLEID